MGDNLAAAAHAQDMAVTILSCVDLPCAFHMWHPINLPYPGLMHTCLSMPACLHRRRRGRAARLPRATHASRRARMRAWRRHQPQRRPRSGIPCPNPRGCSSAPSRRWTCGGRRSNARWTRASVRAHKLSVLCRGMPRTSRVPQAHWEADLHFKPRSFNVRTPCGFALPILTHFQTIL